MVLVLPSGTRCSPVPRCLLSHHRVGSAQSLGLNGIKVQKFTLLGSKCFLVQNYLSMSTSHFILGNPLPLKTDCEDCTSVTGNIWKRTLTSIRINFTQILDKMCLDIKGTVGYELFNLWKLHRKKAELILADTIRCNSKQRSANHQFTQRMIHRIFKKKNNNTNREREKCVFLKMNLAFPQQQHKRQWHLTHHE